MSMKQSSSSFHGVKEKHGRAKTDDYKKSRSHDPSQPMGDVKNQKESKQDKELMEEPQLDEKIVSELPTEYKPIYTFLDSKEVMIEQLYNTIHGSDLTPMIPKALKGYSVDEVKKLCLDELNRMPNKMIIHVLRGGDISTYAKAKCEKIVKEEHSDSELTPVLKRKIKTELAASSSLASNPKRTAFEDVTGTPVSSHSPLCSESISNEEFLELYPSTNEMETLVQIEKKEVPPVECNEDSDLELLELEMRARAIRSLLRSRGLPSSDEEDKEIKSELMK